MTAVRVQPWALLDDAAIRLIADARAVVADTPAMTSDGMRGDWPALVLGASFGSSRRAVWMDGAGHWKSTAVLAPMETQREFSARVAGRVFATTTARKEHVLDPSIRFTMHAESKTHEPGAWVAIDVRQGIADHIRFTIDAAELLRMIDDAVALVVQGGR